VAAAAVSSLPLLLGGLFGFGSATACGLQARYAAADLAAPEHRGRALSLVVWATTVGSVLGPNLAGPGDTLARHLGLPALGGAFVVSIAVFAVVVAGLLLLLRPDPAVVAHEMRGSAAPSTPDASPGTMRAALRVVASHPPARLGVIAVAVGHVVMIGVMTMTPVHIRSAGHGPAHTLHIVGVVLSSHIAGMFACSPLFGWLTDRLGRRPVIFIGIGLLLAACALAGTAGRETAPLAGSLMLLGLGWSATMVAGSTLLSESVPADLRPSAQGLSDLAMGLAGASAGALSGVVVEAWGYPKLTLLAALATVPLIVLVSFSTSRASGLRPPVGSEAA